MLTITSRDLERATHLIRARTGILLGSYKEDMVGRNLVQNTKKLSLPSVSAYLDHLEHNVNAPEWDRFIGIFTINHTAFFRERHHFDILAQFVKERKKPISVWSSACSTGEEPYSIAIALREAIAVPDNGVSVFATDVDAAAVERGRQGVYAMERVEPVDKDLLHKYFHRGTGSFNGMVRVKAPLQNLVEFGVANLISGEGWPQGKQFDAVFCRNVMIYFDKPTQEKLLARFKNVVKPGGLLFIGHSESITHMTDAFKLQGQTVYVRI